MGANLAIIQYTTLLHNLISISLMPKSEFKRHQPGLSSSLLQHSCPSPRELCSEHVTLKKIPAPATLALTASIVPAVIQMDLLEVCLYCCRHSFILTDALEQSSRIIGSGNTPFTSACRTGIPTSHVERNIGSQKYWISLVEISPKFHLPVR